MSGDSDHFFGTLILIRFPFLVTAIRHAANGQPKTGSATNRYRPDMGMTGCLTLSIFAVVQ